MLVQNINKLQQFLKKSQIYRRIPNWFWAEKILAGNLNLNKLDYAQNTNKILIKPYNFFLSQDKPEYHFLLTEKNLRLAKTLNQDFNTEFNINEKQDLVINIEGIKSVIKCEQDLEIIKEIFVQGVYNFIYDKPLVVIDIGLNTGWASLYFASQNNVQAIYSYEPFKQTYEEALNNFSLNSEIAEKIHPFNYGISDKEETINVEYNYELKASIGVEGIPDNMKKNKQESLQKEEILIKSASEVFSHIFNQYPDVDFMAKIDCEGSEYNILQSLEENNLLGRFKIIIMEWHEKGPDKLVEYLTKANFTIFSRRPKSKTIGMIYAVRC